MDVEVQDHVASVISTLSYDNSEDKPVEVVFVFPLPGDAAVCHFSATIGQKQIVAEVKEKQQVSWQLFQWDLTRINWKVIIFAFSLSRLMRSMTML